MVDLNQFTTVAGLAVLIGILVQVIKQKVNPSQMPFLAIGLGVVLALAIGYVQGQIQTLAAVLSWCIGGLFAGLTAVGGYEATIQQVKNAIRQ